MIRFYDAEKLKHINPETLKLVRKYRMDMELRELSDKTINGYINDLEQWFIYIYDNQANVCITELDEDDLTEFFYYCKTEGNNSRRMKRRMSAISAFYKFLFKKRIIQMNPMDYIDRPKKDTDITVQTFLSKEQVDLLRIKLQENVDNEGNDAREMQLYALFSLSTMARVNAVANITWKQVDFEERIVNDVLEKEGKVVTLYFSEEVKQLMLKLIDYRKENNIDDGGYIFYSDFRGNLSPISVSTLSNWAKRVGMLIDVPTLHPHDFRHSGSQLLKLAGCPIEEISELLHHESIDVTKKFYLRQDKKKLRETKDKYSF
jgi:site-specific recombinase XerD